MTEIRLNGHCHNQDREDQERNAKILQRQNALAMPSIANRYDEIGLWDHVLCLFKPFANCKVLKWRELESSAADGANAPRRPTFERPGWTSSRLPGATIGAR